MATLTTIHALTFASAMVVNVELGLAGVFDVYGRRPWHKDFGNEGVEQPKYDPLFRFQGEFARRFGSYRRGRAFTAGSLDLDRDSDDYHQYQLDLEKKRR